MGMGAYAQETKKTFTPEQQEMIDLSNAKWKWMSEKDVDKLDALFHENSMFVHMGGSWGKQPELDVIRTGNIHYKHRQKSQIRKFCLIFICIYHYSPTVRVNAKVASFHCPSSFTYVSVTMKGNLTSLPPTTELR